MKRRAEAAARGSRETQVEKAGRNLADAERRLEGAMESTSRALRSGLQQLQLGRGSVREDIEREARSRTAADEAGADVRKRLLENDLQAQARARQALADRAADSLKKTSEEQTRARGAIRERRSADVQRIQGAVVETVP